MFFYNKLFNVDRVLSSPNFWCGAKIVLSLVYLDNNNGLLASLSHDEIRSTFFSMDPNSAPVPDGIWFVLSEALECHWP